MVPDESFFPEHIDQCLEPYVRQIGQVREASEKSHFLLVIVLVRLRKYLIVVVFAENCENAAILASIGSLIRLILEEGHLTEAFARFKLSHFFEPLRVFNLQEFHDSVHFSFSKFQFSLKL